MMATDDPTTTAQKPAPGSSHGQPEPAPDQGDNRTPAPSSPPSWTEEGEPRPTTDEPALD